MLFLFLRLLINEIFFKYGRSHFYQKSRKYIYIYVYSSFVFIDFDTIIWWAKINRCTLKKKKNGWDEKDTLLIIGDPQASHNVSRVPIHIIIKIIDAQSEWRIQGLSLSFIINGVLSGAKNAVICLLSRTSEWSRALHQIHHVNLLLACLVSYCEVLTSLGNLLKQLAVCFLFPQQLSNRTTKQDDRLSLANSL